jgi:Ca-activated chloride channel family protein
MRGADRFRLIAFSSTVRHFRNGFTPATAGNLAAARSFVDALGAEGGTNIAGALEAALGATPDAERLSLVVFMTDGLPSVGEQRPERIAAQAAGQIGRRRIFTVGVGHDVNTFLPTGSRRRPRKASMSRRARVWKWPSEACSRRSATPRWSIFASWTRRYG